MSTAQSVIEDAVIEMLTHTGPCMMDEVVRSLPTHGWSEVFSAVDEMSRDGRLVIRRPSSSGYQLTLSASCQENSAERTRPMQVRFCAGCGYLCDETHLHDEQTCWIEAHQYLKKYGLGWSSLDRWDDFCPACARVLACGKRRIPQRVAATTVR